MTVVKTKKKPHGIKARVNHEETLRFMITTPVAGKNGAYVAFREAVNNSIDANASQVVISIGLYEKQAAIIISDNGKGFNAAGINSAMSYAASSRKREDAKTIGTNGTGLKSFLGLGNLDKTKLTILSVHKDLPDCTKMEIDFDYLLGLAKGKVKPDQYVSTISVPSDWSKDIQRTQR